MRGEFDFQEEVSPALRNFWLSIPDERFIVSSDDRAPKLYSQVQELKNLVDLKSGISNRPTDIGYIETLVRRTVYFNIYSWQLIYLSLEESESYIKSLVLDFIGEIIHVFREVSDQLYKDYKDFFILLKEEIRGLDKSQFVDLDNRVSIRLHSSIEWLGSEDQLKVLYEELLKPIEERKKEIRFISKENSFDDFKSVFKKNSHSKIKWLEITPTNGQPTLANLFHLFDLLKKEKLIPHASMALIRRTIKSHFINEALSGKSISNTKIKSSPSTVRALRILEIVNGLRDA